MTKIITSGRHAIFQADVHARLQESITAVHGEEHKCIATAMRRRIFRMLGDGHDPAGHTQHMDGRKIRRIAVFRYDALGDYIVTTPLLRWLRSALPHARIDIMASQRNARLAAADPFIDRHFILHDRRTLLHGSIRRMLREIGPRDYDLVFALPTNRMTRCALLARMIAPRAEKITLQHGPRRNIYGQVFHRQLNRPPGLEHWAETFFRMATETITPVETPFAGGCRPYLIISERGRRQADSFMKNEGLCREEPGRDLVPERGWNGGGPVAFQGDPYCVVNISAHCSERQWSPERCAEVCRELIRRQPGLRLYVTGASTDVDDIKRAVDLVGHWNCRALGMGLDGFTAFVAGASLVISPDTATVHMAAAAGRPVVGLYAEDIKAAEWFPYGTSFTLLVSPSEESINLIDSGAIVESACGLLQKAEAAKEPVPVS